MKDGQVSDDDLESLAEGLAGHWEKLGRRLQVSNAEIIGVRRNQEYPELSAKALAMLMIWKEREGRAATYQTLYHALCHRNVQRRDLAEEICQKKK